MGLAGSHHQAVKLQQYTSWLRRNQQDDFIRHRELFSCVRDPCCEEWKLRQTRTATQLQMSVKASDICKQYRETDCTWIKNIDTARHGGLTLTATRLEPQFYSSILFEPTTVGRYPSGGLRRCLCEDFRKIQRICDRIGSGE